MTLFHLYLDVAINNSFVLYCLARGEYEVADITDGKYHFKGLLEFKASLVDQLLERAAVHIPPHRAVMSALRSLSPVDDVGGSSFAHHSPGVHLPTFETVRCDDAPPGLSRGRVRMRAVPLALGATVARHAQLAFLPSAMLAMFTCAS